MSSSGLPSLPRKGTRQIGPVTSGEGAAEDLQLKASPFRVGMVMVY